MPNVKKIIFAIIVIIIMLSSMFAWGYFYARSSSGNEAISEKIDGINRKIADTEQRVRLEIEGIKSRTIVINEGIRKIDAGIEKVQGRLQGIGNGLHGIGNVNFESRGAIQELQVIIGNLDKILESRK